jgi:hypothetical protein
MSKPTLVIHPVTGQQCYTKHPEKLLAKQAVCMRDGVMYGKQWEDRTTFWNGSGPSDAMRLPGEVRS